MCSDVLAFMALLITMVSILLPMRMVLNLCHNTTDFCNSSGCCQNCYKNFSLRVLFLVTVLLLPYQHENPSFQCFVGPIHKALPLRHFLHKCKVAQPEPHLWFFLLIYCCCCCCFSFWLLFVSACMFLFLNTREHNVMRKTSCFLVVRSLIFSIFISYIYISF